MCFGWALFCTDWEAGWVFCSHWTTAKTAAVHHKAFQLKTLANAQNSLKKQLIIHIHSLQAWCCLLIKSCTETWCARKTSTSFFLTAWNTMKRPQHTKPNLYSNLSCTLTNQMPDACYCLLIKSCSEAGCARKSSTSFPSIFLCLQVNTMKRPPLSSDCGDSFVHSGFTGRMRGWSSGPHSTSNSLTSFRQLISLSEVRTVCFFGPWWSGLFRQHHQSVFLLQRSLRCISSGEIISLDRWSVLGSAGLHELVIVTEINWLIRPWIVQLLNR